MQEGAKRRAGSGPVWAFQVPPTRKYWRSARVLPSVRLIQPMQRGLLPTCQPRHQSIPACNSQTIAVRNLWTRLVQAGARDAGGLCRSTSRSCPVFQFTSCSAPSTCSSTHLSSLSRATAQKSTSWRSSLLKVAMTW